MLRRQIGLLDRLELSGIIDKLIGDKTKEFHQNIIRRKCGSDLDKIVGLWRDWRDEGGSQESGKLGHLLKAALRLPNTSHPTPWALDDQPYQLKLIGHQHPSPPHKQYTDFHKLCEPLNLIRTENLGNLAGKRSYVLLGPMAELEQGLIRFTLDTLRDKDFELISVPDLLYPHVLEGCGMPTTGDRNQVYWIEMGEEGEEEDKGQCKGQGHEDDVCLSGTSEMGIGGLLQDGIFDLSEGPLRFVAVSRCFRSEISTAEEERGIYRVHGFTKVEMFGVSEEGQSEDLHQEFLAIQEELFGALDLHYRVLEMPVCELGNAAHRKFDIEAWMPGREMWGEISSTSNCTDYQARRLNIRHKVKGSDQLKFVHTVNGTACAVPRMLIALIERGQLSSIPPPLEKYLRSPWTQLVSQHPKIKSNFLRKNNQQENITKEYNPWIW